MHFYIPPKQEGLQDKETAAHVAHHSYNELVSLIVDRLGDEVSLQAKPKSDVDRPESTRVAAEEFLGTTQQAHLPPQLAPVLGDEQNQTSLKEAYQDNAADSDSITRDMQVYPGSLSAVTKDSIKH